MNWDAVRRVEVWGLWIIVAIIIAELCWRWL